MLFLNYHHLRSDSSVQNLGLKEVKIPRVQIRFFARVQICIQQKAYLKIPITPPPSFSEADISNLLLLKIIGVETLVSSKQLS